MNYFYQNKYKNQDQEQVQNQIQNQIQKSSLILNSLIKK